jgi:hypothetical protein
VQLFFFRSPKDIIRVTTVLQNDQSKIETEELPRMKAVMKSFEIYRWIEILLIPIGIVSFLSFPSISSWKGIRLGLTIQANIMLVLDFFGENRGKVYIDYLQSL